jgi:hypothetical protein
MLPAGAVAGARASTGPIDAETLAADALAPEDLLHLIEDAGFADGVERSFGGARGPLDLVVARSLAFADDAGADAYLSWLHDHVSDILGSSEPLRAPGLPSGALFVRHLPDGCCPKEVPVFLTAWRRGNVVLFLKASGRAARPEPVTRLATAFDRQL